MENASSAKGAPYRILLVEDDIDAASEIIELCSLHGYEVLHFTTSQKLLAHVSATPVAEVIICDIHLPDMTGIKLMEVIREELPLSKQPQFLFVTGHSDVSNAVSALRLGAVDFLSKPVAGEDLIKTVGRAILRIGTQSSRVSGSLADIPPTDDEIRHYELTKKALELELKRSKLSNRNLFGDPSWSLLLALFLADFKREVVFVGTLSLDAGVPLSTVTRRLADLELEGFLSRQKDGADQRRTVVALGDKGRKVVRDYLAAIANLSGKSSDGRRVSAPKLENAQNS